jgi:hypothetical protein
VSAVTLRQLISLAMLLATLPCSAADTCGELVSLGTHERSTTRYSFAPPKAGAASGGPIAVVLLAGGGGHLDLDDDGCARQLTGNSLVRSMPLFRAAGFFAALVDAPSGYHGEDGLGGFRVAEAHAQDLGKVITDVRARSKGQVWLVGTSRGSISAVNAAARLSGASAPDGVVLTSALMAGQVGAKKAWVAHSVFDLRLEAIRVPVLVVGHAADLCLRSPAGLMGNIVARTSGVREQVVTVTGGPAARSGTPSVSACEGRSPHGFVDQEAEVAAGIARFVRGGAY